MLPEVATSTRTPRPPHHAAQVGGSGGPRDYPRHYHRRARLKGQRGHIPAHRRRRRLWTPTCDRQGSTCCSARAGLAGTTVGSMPWPTWKVRRTGQEFNYPSTMISQWT